MISRYDPSSTSTGKMRPEPFGNWIAYTDHEKEKETLEEKIEWAHVDYKSFRKRYDALEEIRDELLVFLTRIKSDSNWVEWAFDPQDDEIQEGELERIIEKVEKEKERK